MLQKRYLKEEIQIVNFTELEKLMHSNNLIIHKTYYSRGSAEDCGVVLLYCIDLETQRKYLTGIMQDDCDDDDCDCNKYDDDDSYTSHLYPCDEKDILKFLDVQIAGDMELLSEGIQETQAQVKELEKKIDELEKQIKKYEEEISELEDKF